MLLIWLGFADVAAEDPVRLDSSAIAPAVRGGHSMSIRWSASRDSLSLVDIEVSTDGGKTWNTVGNDVRARNRHFLWKVPKDLNAAKCRIRLVQHLEDGTEITRSETPAGSEFMIDSVAPTVTVTGPATSTDRRVRIDYKVEDAGSGADTVRLYYRPAGATTWKIGGKQVRAGQPLIFEAEGRGRWEIHLTARDKARLSTPTPNAGTPPMLTVNVDSGEPAVTINVPNRRTVTGRGGTYTIGWQATDDDLGANPVTLSWRDRNRRWHVLAKDLANTGSYEWKLPDRDLRVERFRVQVTDLAGNTSEASQLTTLVHDVTAPSLRLRGPTEWIPRDPKSRRTLRLDYRDAVRGGGKIVKMRLFSKKLGSKDDWTEHDISGVGMYDKIPFEQPDGRYELVLIGEDEAGNIESEPARGDKGELRLIVDRALPVIRITGLEKRGDALLVRWEARDANLPSTPVNLDWGSGSARALPASGERLIELAGQTSLTLNFRVADLAQRVGSLRHEWKGEQTPIVVPTVPELQFTSQGGVTGPGRELVLTWQGDKLDGLKGELVRDGKVVETRDLPADARRLTWKSGATHNIDEFWRFTVKDKQWPSKAWTVDAEVPTYKFDRLPAEIMAEELTVSIAIEDDPAGLAEAFLYHRNEGETSWKRRALRAGANTVLLPVNPGTLQFYVGLEDRAGNARPAPAETTAADASVLVRKPEAAAAQLAFAADSNPYLAPGKKTIRWTAANLGTVEMVLVDGEGSEIDRRKVAAADGRLEWTVRGEHMTTRRWEAMVDGRKVVSRTWQVDAVAPRGEIRPVGPVGPTVNRVDVTVTMSDQPSGIGRAILHVADNAQMRNSRQIVLDKSKVEQTVAIDAPDGDFYLGLEVADKAGNRLAAGDLPVQHVRRAVPMASLAFTAGPGETILKGGDAYTLEWTAENIGAGLELERQEAPGQWVLEAKLDAEVRQHLVRLPDADRSALIWRIRSGGKVLAETRHVVKVDASAPTVRIATPAETAGAIELTINLDDSGPAGWDEAELYARARGQAEWQLVQRLTKDREQKVSVDRDPGTWEFAASIRDRFGRGLPRPAAGTAALAVATVRDTRQPFLKLALRDSDQGLVLGGTDVLFDLTGQKIPENARIVVTDAEGKAVQIVAGSTIATQGSMAFAVRAPRVSRTVWTLKAEVGETASNPVTVRVDFENPTGRLAVEGPTGTRAPIRVTVLSEDLGPAGVDRFDLYRSDDRRETWTLIANAKEVIDFGHPGHDRGIHLYLRVRDKVGQWSKAEPAARSPADAELTWSRRSGVLAFESFNDAGLYRGGETREIRWNGLNVKGHLQYRADAGQTWVTIAEVGAGQTSSSWTLPRMNSREVLLRIVGTSGEVVGVLKTPFAIDSTPTKSTLTFVPSDVVEDKVEYTRPTRPPGKTREPRVPPEGRTPDWREGPRLPDPDSTVERKPDPADPDEPYDFASYVASARNAIKKREYGRAARYLESAHRISDRVAETHDMLAQCYQKMHREDKMIVEQLHKAVALDPRLSRAWNHLGVMARLRNDSELARRYFRRALDIRAMPETHLNMGIMDQEAGKVMEARDHYIKVRQLLRTTPKSGAYKESTWRLTLLYTYSAIKDVDVARRYWAQVLELFGRDSWQGKRARKWLRDHDTTN